MRHNPQLIPFIMNAAVDEVDVIARLGREYERDGVDDQSEDGGFFVIMIYATSILKLIGYLLSRDEAIFIFLELDGLSSVNAILKIAHLPIEYTLTALGSLVPIDTVPFDYPVISCLDVVFYILECFVSRRADTVINFIASQVGETLSSVETELALYKENHWNYESGNLAFSEEIVGTLKTEYNKASYLLDIDGECPPLP